MTYVGFTTKDIRERMEEHNRGITKTTASHIPWQVEVVVSFSNKDKAKEFEQYLKGGSGYAFAKRHFWNNSVRLVKEIGKEENRSSKLAK